MQKKDKARYIQRENAILKPCIYKSNVPELINIRFKEITLTKAMMKATNQRLVNIEYLNTVNMNI